MARKVRVTAATPRTLWCRADSNSASVSGGGCSRGGGGGRVGDNSRRNKRNTPSISTGVAIGSNGTESVEPTDAIAEEAMDPGAGGNISSWRGSPDESAPISSGRCRGGARELSMYPVVEAPLVIEKMSTSDTINCEHSLTSEGSGTYSLGVQGAQARRAELHANTGEWQGAAIQATTTVGVPTAREAVDDGIVCSVGASGGENPVFPSAASVPTAATGSLVASRVPGAKVTKLVWDLPDTELTSRGFRWREGVEEIQFGSFVFMDDPPKKFEIFSFRECLDGPSGPGCSPLPPGLKRVNFSANWNLNLGGARENWPESLEVIDFPQHFNQPLSGDGFGLPLGLREVCLGEAFNHPLVGVEWPPSLQTLHLSNHFDQSLEGVKFPSGLQELYLGNKFRREVDGVVWPKGLKRLQFGVWFNQALVPPGAEGGPPLGRKHSLPASLKFLRLGDCFNQPLSGNELPDGLEVLMIGRVFQYMSSVRWPSMLKELYVQTRWIDDGPWPIVLPPKLETLTLGRRFDSPLTAFAFPPTLKVLKLGEEFNQPIGWKDGDNPLLPDGLEVLRLGCCFNRSIENVRLPVGLKCLVLGSPYESAFDKDLAGVIWPPGLEELTLGDCFDQPVEGTSFPETLRELSFGQAFSYSLQGVALPNELTRLSFGSRYSVFRLQELKWPCSLRSLHVGDSVFRCGEDLAKWVAQRLG